MAAGSDDDDDDDEAHSCSTEENDVEQKIGYTV